ncbi:hypothetical protein R6Q59_013832 [Mikania micrantha]
MIGELHKFVSSSWAKMDNIGGMQGWMAILKFILIGEGPQFTRNPGSEWSTVGASVVVHSCGSRVSNLAFGGLAMVGYGKSPMVAGALVQS